MKVWHEEVDVAIGGVLVREVDHWGVSAQKVANRRFFVGSNSG